MTGQQTSDHRSNENIEPSTLDQSPTASIDRHRYLGFSYKERQPAAAPNRPVGEFLPRSALAQPASSALLYGIGRTLPSPAVRDALLISAMDAHVHTDGDNAELLTYSNRSLLSSAEFRV